MHVIIFDVFAETSITLVMAREQQHFGTNFKMVIWSHFLFTTFSLAEQLKKYNLSSPEKALYKIYIYIIHETIAISDTIFLQFNH